MSLEIKMFKIGGVLVVFSILAPFFGGAQSLATSGRVKEKFDFNWQFHKGDIAMKRAVKAGKQGGLTDAKVKVSVGEEAVIAYTDKNKTGDYKPNEWVSVNLPHDWSVGENVVNERALGSAPSSNGWLPTGVGFYRKEFEIPETDKGRKISIVFDGIFRNSTVWVNGHILGGHESGYTPSEYDLTDVLRYGAEGKNVIFVKVDATAYEGWWYEGAGIYRHTWLIKTNPLHVASHGTFVTTPSVTERVASVNIQTTIQNEYTAPKQLTLVSKISDGKGTIVDVQSSKIQVAALEDIVISQNGRVQRPSLWSPETPNLYTVLSEIYENNKIIDAYTTSFGIRTAEITKDGFFLNGKLYPIKGTANHQDFAGVGVAVPDKVNEYRVKLLKEMGSNGYRSAHNPPTPELLDICDRLGMLVLDENRYLSSSEQGKADLKSLIVRDRNHPSVFMWSLENEESIEGTPTGARILKTLVDVAHQLDPSRQVTAAMNHGWNDGGYSDALDVVGYNYGQRGKYVKDKGLFPDRKMLVTESTSFVSTRGVYADDKDNCLVSNMGEGTAWGLKPGLDWQEIVSYPYLSGQFAWTGFDYRGEPTPYAGKWPCVLSHFGIMDLCGFPKDGYYAYKAAWGNEPVVHVFPHWNWPDKIGQTIKVMGYTNCDEVELILNGKSLGKKKAEPYNRMDWDVVYMPGTLEAKGYKGGKEVTQQVITTTEKASKLSLVSDVKTLKADGCDVAVVNVSVKDDKGRVVPIANNLISFTIKGSGKIIGTGNGNPGSTESSKSPQRMAFNGYCQVLVQADKTAGEIELKATSDGLQTSIVTIKVSQ